MKDFKNVHTDNIVARFDGTRSLRKRFFTWVRGTEYPSSATWESWDSIHEEARVKHPFRFWVSDTAIPFVIRLVKWPVRKYRDVRAYLDNRFVHKTHMLPTYLPKGMWADADYRLLHGMFGLLRQYVEEECSQMGQGGTKRAAGMDHLQWEQHCENPTQEEAAREIESLYVWWMDDRPVRRDAFEYVYEEGETYEEKYHYHDMKEKEYLDQDQENMLRLIKVSPCMWL